MGEVHVYRVVCVRLNQKVLYIYMTSKVYSCLGKVKISMAFVCKIIIHREMEREYVTILSMLSVMMVMV